MKYFIASKSIIKLLVLLLVFSWNQVQSQGKTHNFLIGYQNAAGTWTTHGKGRLLLNSNSIVVIGENRKMPFQETQANISDENGNLLISTNGCWIADATGDTMMNGSGLSPNAFTNDYCNLVPIGLPIMYGNIILPYPNILDKYILFHQTGNYNANAVSTEIYYSEIDLSLNGGLGAVTSKNQIILNDNLVWGLAACKHANGRDWWIVALRDASTIIHKFLLDSSGITYMGIQNLGFPAPVTWGNATQPTFSPDGTKFVYGSGRGGGISTAFHDVRLFNFDRCTGNFTGLAYIALNDSSTGFGLAFSPDSKYLYNSSFQRIYQFNTDTSDIAASKTIVAVNDGYYSPVPPYQSDFWLMYLAANGKIYISSGNSVIDLHYINFPDSTGMACDVHLHDLHLPCFNVGSVPNHPNYYLGCDTTQTSCPCLTTGINEINQHDFRFSISPNPNNGNFRIMYLLPQNKSGTLQIFDITGKEIYHQTLPPWSTLQYISLPKIADGVYQCTITSNNQRVNKKLVVVE
ncbi:MAG: legume lectin beta domain-containing protein [Bacteroidetes bacterium OLB10]|nr:MAG: legume lectin beta domain-containing protein [Bacteroidetes bacterium OLB10]